MPDEYDLIVIGSGMGGLTVASLAARLRARRVLLLERHFKLGGFTHDFRRGKFQWDVGLHYVGELGERSPMRKVMDLVTGGEVRWTKMPDPVERFVYPGLTFDVPVGEKAYRDALIERFPAEEAALRRYFTRIKRAGAGFVMHVLRRNRSLVLRMLGHGVGWIRPKPGGPTTKEVLDEMFESAELRALLASIWGTYGLPPMYSAFAVHGLLVQHYLDGAWFPVGGAGRIAESVKRAVEAAGGKTRVRREVEEILVEDGRAVGVRARSTAVGREDEVEAYRAPVIVSNAGAATTWCRMVPDDHAEPQRSTLRAFLARHPVSTTLVLYVGLSESAETLGFHGENHWIYRDIDHDGGFEGRSAWLEHGEPPGLYVSFPSLKDPEARSHTAEAMTFSTDYGDFARWKDAPWRRRGPEYEALKKRIVDRMLDFIERHHPGFRALVVHAELSTPITNEHFSNHPQGRVYGLPLVPELFDGEIARATHPRTDIPGLYLTGADAGMFGILGAVLTGVTTFSHVPGGVSTMRVFKAASRAAAVR